MKPVEEEQDPFQAIEEVPSSNVPSTKVLIDGTLYIIRPDGEVFNILGAEVR